MITALTYIGVGALLALPLNGAVWWWLLRDTHHDD